ncbi:hypothetical protein KY314_00340 [Candidatus Woesearchaeota archaeon]|nr:hypothetical protein [Candidatus Woesearchaeota archaeon]
MPKRKREITEIVPNEFYNLSEIIRMGKKHLFPYTQEELIKQFIKEEKLRCIKAERGTRPSYRVKGEWLLEFIENYEKGTFSPKET